MGAFTPFFTVYRERELFHVYSIHDMSLLLKLWRTQAVHDVARILLVERGPVERLIPTDEI